MGANRSRPNDGRGNFLAVHAAGVRMNHDVIRRYGIAAAFVLVAFVCTLLLQRFFPYPFLFLFFAAVMASAWFGGTGAGFVAVLVSTVVVAYFFVPPYYSWAITPTA